MAAIKLSAAQEKVLERLRNGWGLAVSHGFDARCWMQSNGIGRGGEMVAVSFPTVRKLEEMGCIVRGESNWRLTKYQLSNERKGD